MGRVCAAVNCTSRQKKDSGISFHEFPHKRPEILKKWLENVRRDKWFPREKSSFLCSQHFLQDCFEGGRQTLRRLRDDAVPSVFDYTVKSRKRKLSSTARIKRLATSLTSVMTCSVERNHLQKSTVRPQQKNKQNTIQSLTGNTTDKNHRRSLRNIENRLTPLRKSRLLRRKKYANRHIEHEHEEDEQLQDINVHKRIRFSVEENSRKYNVLGAARSEIPLVNSKRHRAPDGGSSADNGYQTITIVPTVTSGTGDVSYRLIVQDSVETGTPVSTVTASSTKHKPCNLKMPKSTTQRLPSNRESDKDDDSQLMKCTYCRYVTRKRYLLSRHLRVHLERHPHQCDQCPLSFRTLLALQNHVNTHRGVRPFRCRRCDDRFTTSNELVTHVQSCHENNNRDIFERLEVEGRELSVPYFCPLCAFVGSDARSLKRHLVAHSAEEVFECNVCDVRVDSREHLREHRSAHLS